MVRTHSNDRNIVLKFNENDAIVAATISLIIVVVIIIIIIITIIIGAMYCKKDRLCGLVVRVPGC
jgi:uncharacterized membrane protein YqiK